MGLDGCGKCMKYTMIVANFIIMVGGLSVLSIGIWTCVDKSSFEKLMDSNLYMSAAYILIATGVVVVIISVIGCLGALRDIKCLLLTYFIILFIIFVIMLVGGILACVYKNQVREELKKKMEVSLEMQYGITPGIQDTWDLIQDQFKCCGTSLEGKDSSHSWEQSEYFKRKENEGLFRPKSCCRKKAGSDSYEDDTKCQKEKTPENKFTYTDDCFNATISEIEHHSQIVGGVGIGIACILILGMIFSMVLFKLIE